MLIRLRTRLPLLLLLCTGLAFSLLFQETAAQEQGGGARFYLYEDEGGRLSAAEAANRFYAGAFRPQGKAIFYNAGFTRSVFWMVVHSPVAGPAQVLRLGEPHINKLDLYRLERGQKTYTPLYQTGDHLPFGTRPIDASDFVFPMAPHQWYLIRADKLNESVRLLGEVLPRETVYRQEHRQLIITFTAMGMILLMGFFMVYLYHRTGQILYLWYVGYMLAGWGYVLANSGFGFQFLWPHWAWFASRSRPFFLFTMACMLYMFLRHYIGPPHIRLRLFLRIMCWLHLGFIALILVGSTSSNQTAVYEWFFKANTYTFLAFILGMAVWIGLQAIQRQRRAIVYLVSIVPLLIANVWSVAYFSGVNTGLTGHTHQHLATLGFIVEMLVLTMMMIEEIDGNRTAKLAAEERLRLLEAQTNKLLVNTQRAERVQIADQLHDIAGSMLSAARMNLRAAIDLNTQEKLGTHLGFAHKVLNTLSVTIRNMSHALNPQTLVEDGLVQSIENVVLLFNASGRLQIRLSVCAHLRTATQLRYSGHIIYNSVYELLNNVAKHSGATQAELVLRMENRIIFLTLSDDGYGEAEAVLNHQGNGLKRVRERIEAAGGAFTIAPAKPQGIEIHISLPADECVANAAIQVT